MRDEVAVDANIRHRPILPDGTGRQNVRLCTGYRGLRDPEGRHLSESGRKEELVPGKTVICAAGQRARRKSRTVFWEQRLYIAQIGDCIAPLHNHDGSSSGISRCA